MRPFKRFKSIRFFRMTSQLLVLALLALLLVNKFSEPLDFWLFITAFISLPFVGVMFWIDQTRHAKGEFSLYFAALLFSAACFVIFGFTFMAEYFTHFGQLMFALIQLVFALLVYLMTEKFGRHLGEPPMRTKTTLRFY